MSRPWLLDLFCGAGGAAVGYDRAGFAVVGVDIEPQPNYPYEFIQADAMSYSFDGFDAVHASPPCHDHSPLHHGSGIDYGTGWMLAETIARLRGLEVPWVVENVNNAKFPGDVHVFRLCGSGFGLDVKRHRLFASNLLLMSVPCHHAAHQRRYPQLRSKELSGGRLSRVVGVHGHLNYKGERELREAAMGIDWMTTAELAQAIPPAYTEHIGQQLIGALRAP